jgi:hypothetical protein
LGESVQLSGMCCLQRAEEHNRWPLLGTARQVFWPVGTLTAAIAQCWIETWHTWWCQLHPRSDAIAIAGVAPGVSNSHILWCVLCECKITKNEIIRKIRKTLGSLFLIIHSLYTVSTHSFELFSMSGYYSDSQGTLSLTSSESDAGLPSTIGHLLKQPIIYMHGLLKY